MAFRHLLLFLLLTFGLLQSARPQAPGELPSLIDTNLCVPVTIWRGPSSQYLASTNMVVLSVSVDGTGPFFYQWYKDGFPISGANEPSLTLSNLHTSDDGFYNVEVTNCGGSERSWEVAVFLNGIVVDLPDPGTVINFSGSLLPPGLTNIIAIAAGEYHGLGLRHDRTVVAWGNEFAEALGLTNVPAGLSNVFAIAAGHDYSLALLGNGTLTGWGPGECAHVPEIHARIVGLAAGPFRASALTEGGTVVQWGVDPTLPFDLQDVVSLAETLTYTAVVKRDGTLEIYGAGPALLSQPTKATLVATDEDVYAVDSDGTVANLTSFTPLPPNGFTGVSAISTRQGRGLIITKQGYLEGWGNLTIPPLAQKVSAIAVGGLYCLAIAADPPLPAIRLGLGPEGLNEIVAPIAVSGWQLEMTERLGEPFRPFDPTTALSRGTPFHPALILPPSDAPHQFYRLQKIGPP